jgi:hypothetical protein
MNKSDSNIYPVSAIYFQNGGHDIALSGATQKGEITLDGQKNCVVLTIMGCIKNIFLFPQSLPRNKEALAKLGYKISVDRIDKRFWKN